MAMESHTPEAWLGAGASQELYRDFVLGTCFLWSSTQQKGKGEMAKHAMPQVTAEGDSLFQRPLLPQGTVVLRPSDISHQKGKTLLTALSSCVCRQ